MRDRLIELISESNAKNLNVVQMLGFEKLILAEDLLANGVIVPPCKVGDVVYVVNHCFSYIAEYEVRGFHFGEFPTLNGHKRNPYLIGYFKTSGMLKHIFIKDIGKTVFLTREEAERALRATDNNVGDK